MDLCKATPRENRRLFQDIKEYIFPGFQLFYLFWGCAIHTHEYIYIHMYICIYIYACVCGWTDDPKLTLAAVTWCLSSRFIDVSPNHKWITEIWMQFKGCNISDPYWKITIGGWKRDSGKFTHTYIYIFIHMYLQSWNAGLFCNRLFAKCIYIIYKCHQLFGVDSGYKAMQELYGIIMNYKHLQLFEPTSN